MQRYIYIDYENMSNIKELPRLENVKYFVFIGANQKPKLSYVPGTRVRIIKIEKTGKNALDYKLKDFMQKRINVQNTMHYIISKDKGYDACINDINLKKARKIAYRREGINFLQ